MENTNVEWQKKIKAMRNQLRKMHKRSEIALKKAEAQLWESKKKYQKELADYTRKYIA